MKCGAAVAIALVLSIRIAGAQEPDAGARAQALFDAAQRLLDAGSVLEACRTFDESYRAEPAGGTLLNLAVCWERAGRWATAHATLEQALERAEAEGRADRGEIARRHLAEVAPRVAHVRLLIDASQREQLEAVTIDGEAWDEARWDEARAVDPGDHRITLRSAGAERNVEVTVPSSGATVEVAVQAEQRAPSPDPPPPAPPAAPPSAEPADAGGAPVWMLPLGGATTGVGVVLLAVAAGFGVHALSTEADVEERCPSTICSDIDAVDLNDEVDRSATVADVAFAVGGVTAAGGIGLIIAAAVGWE
jgi:hypothetical protein